MRLPYGDLSLTLCTVGIQKPHVCDWCKKPYLITPWMQTKAQWTYQNFCCHSHALRFEESSKKAKAI